MAQKIAIIEDDKIISQMYQLKFEAEGFEVKTAGNGRLGLTLVQEMQPDIVLLDLMMPEMNGQEVLETMRTTDWGKDIKVVILTNVGESEIAESIQRYTVSGLIIKAQSTPTEVVSKVKEILHVE